MEPEIELEEEEIVCAADVPADEWNRYEQMAEELGEPEGEPVPRDVELV